MSDGLNAEFTLNPGLFVLRHVMTAAMLSRTGTHLQPGRCLFDLRRLDIHGSSIASLELWDCFSSNEAPLFAYWVPQGKSTLVPMHPGPHKTIFTPDFSGCSICVDQVSPTALRVYHVQGGGTYFETEYLFSPHRFGATPLGRMGFDDYGTIQQMRAFAFLRHESGNWRIYCQRQDGPALGMSSSGVASLGPQALRGAFMKIVEPAVSRPRANSFSGRPAMQRAIAPRANSFS